MANPTPAKTLKAFRIDEKLIDQYEGRIAASANRYSKALRKSISAAISDIVVVDGMVAPTAENFAKLERLQREAETLLRANGLDKQIEDVLDVFYKRIETLNKMVVSAGFTNATVDDFERYEDITRSINEFASRVSTGAPAIADEISGAVYNFRNNLSGGGERLRFENLVNTLQTKAGILPNYAKTIGNTELMAIDREARFIQADKAGIQYMRYTGPDDNLTRPFCRSQVGKVRSIAEWKQMRNNTGPQPVSKYAGGYNCRHRLILWKPDWPVDFKDS